jgi:hypothetical protein
MNRLNEEMVKTRAQEMRENLDDFETFLASVSRLIVEGRGSGGPHPCRTRARLGLSPLRAAM